MDLTEHVIFLAADASSNGCHNGVYELLRRRGVALDYADYSAHLDSLAAAGLVAGDWVGQPYHMVVRGGPIDLSAQALALARRLGARMQRRGSLSPLAV